MHKFSVSVIAAVTALLGFGAVANAQYGASEFQVVVSPTTVDPSGQVTITVEGCELGEGLSAELGTQTDDATCAGPSGIALAGRQAQANSGSATMTLSAPASAGTYTGTVTSTTNSATFTVTVVAQATTPTGSLPQTGSNGIGTTTTIALGLVAVGVGMLVVTQIRRRRISLG